MKNLPQPHLTPIAGATLIAWHNSHDVQAVRCADGVERLYINGRNVVPDLKRHFGPTQQVINMCMAGLDAAGVIEWRNNLRRPA